MKFLYKTVLFVGCFVLPLSSCNDPDDDENENNHSTNNKQEESDNEELSVSGSIGRHDYVDLGLPSGTRWATCNVGSTSPEYTGNYYAWGEISVKSSYTVFNSDWSGVEYDKLKSDGVIDSYGNLTSKYDAATMNWGNEWRMPTISEINELNSLQSMMTTIKGVKGRKFIGKNGNTLFIPVAGYFDAGDILQNTFFGECWSSSACQDNNNNNSFVLNYSLDQGSNTSWRKHGLQVRPVCKVK